MLQAYLFRDDISPECIRGIFYVEGEIFHILERPWLNNQPNISCICAGSYEAHFLPGSFSGRYRNIYWIKNVSGRGGILIHNGNVVDHTRGCLIIGKRRGTLAGKKAVLNSRTALQEFIDLTDKQDLTLHIYGSQSC